MNIGGRFWIELDGQPLVGRGRIKLLELIRDTGSISEAARTMKMSYKAAWDAIEAITRVSRQPVVLRTKGGKTGGGTTLTEYGHALIAAFRNMEHEHTRFLQDFQQRYGVALDTPAQDTNLPDRHSQDS